MNPASRHVAVIGAGVAGLTAVEALAGRGIQVSLFEKTPFLGGHAVQLTCKATDRCVKCGACVAEEKLHRATGHAHVDVLTGTIIEHISGQRPLRIHYQRHSPLVNAEACDGCGICFHKCPVPGAILQGHAPRVGPYVAIRHDLCRYFEDAACTLCRDTCPRQAIHLQSTRRSGEIDANAVLVSTGFAPYVPSAKPYGYGLFPNVITSLDAERLLRDTFYLPNPSDGKPAQRIAFIQCVGSRDAQLGHDWCSKICCGSSMRMARLIQSRQESAAISVFYIDVQNFGKDFACAYQDVQDHITMVRAIPGEITRTTADALQVIYFDPQTRASTEAVFDVVVLSVGLTPTGDNRQLAHNLSLPMAESGFLKSHDDNNSGMPAGVFTAGTATGPMSIADSVSSAEKAAYDLMRYLDVTGTP